jgi:hypothetical protein
MGVLAVSGSHGEERVFQLDTQQQSNLTNAMLVTDCTLSSPLKWEVDHRHVPKLVSGTGNSVITLSEVIPQHPAPTGSTRNTPSPYYYFQDSSAVCSDACRHRRSSHVVVY